MITGAHVLALCCGFVIGYALCRLVEAYREVSDDDLAPIPFRSLSPRSVPPASGLAYGVSNGHVSYTVPATTEAERAWMANPVGRPPYLVADTPTLYDEGEAR